MRIISGEAGGIPLRIPKAVSRATTDRVREAIFSMLGTEIEGMQVLDLFAGSGSLGIEALSRGAASAVFVEQNREACRIVESNLAKAKLEGGRVLQQTVDRYIHTAGAAMFDYIFADPPYLKKEGDVDYLTDLLALDRFPALLKPEGRLIFEVAHPCGAPESPLWTPMDYRRYGATGVWILKRA